jgi:hypothetical protein
VSLRSNPGVVEWLGAVCADGGDGLGRDGCADLCTRRSGGRGTSSTSGSARDDGELELLKAVARQRLAAGQGILSLGPGFGGGEGGPPPITSSRMRPGIIEVFAQQWLHRLPMPFTRADQRAGYWWEISIRQVEVSRTLVFDAPRRARGAFFEALIADNLDIGRSANVEIIFGRRIRRDTKGVFRTAIDRPGHRPGRAQRVLQALEDQAVPQRRPGDADRNRRQLPADDRTARRTLHTRPDDLRPATCASPGSSTGSLTTGMS